MHRDLEQFVWKRARSCCEYCGISVSQAELPFQIDHIIAIKHGGLTVAENLALSCFHCNSYKGPNIAGIDPFSGNAALLFHPRKDRWADHFAFDAAVLTGLTPTGRATIAVLVMNHPLAVARREELIRGGFDPRGE